MTNRYLAKIATATPLGDGVSHVAPEDPDLVFMRKLKGIVAEAAERKKIRAGHHGAIIGGVAGAIGGGILGTKLGTKSGAPVLAGVGLGAAGGGYLMRHLFRKMES